MTTIQPTSRTTVRRKRDRGEYDRSTVYSILDEGFVCHVACLVDGTVWMIPTGYARDGDRLLLHGAAGNHLLRAAAAGAELTVTVTMVDGLVLARSTFHHSINYRSVVIFASPTDVTDARQKADALEKIVEHMLPGRTQTARPPTESELGQTRVVSLPLSEVSAKIRTGGPIDDEADMDLAGVWAGVIPMEMSAGKPIADPANPPGVAEPVYGRPA